MAGALGQDPGMGRRDHPIAERGGGLGEGPAEQRPGGPDGVVSRADAHAQAVAQPAGGRGRWLVLVGAGGSEGVNAGEFLEPLAFEAVQQPP
jgi:hypothetical protein